MTTPARSTERSLRPATTSCERSSGAGAYSGDPMLLGVGVSVYVEMTNAIPGDESARIELSADGGAVVYTGTSPHGQGHETAWAMIAAERTGMPVSAIRVAWGDTDAVPLGGGTMGSRSLQFGGAAVDTVAAELVDKARAVAAERLEADVADVVLDTASGEFHVAGTPAVRLTWSDVAAAASEQGAELAAAAPTMPWAGISYPFGAHVAVVEVDAETGMARLVRHVACDDAGRIINPMLVEGQLHGGIATGAAQALMEEVRYDEDGNPITANLGGLRDDQRCRAAELRTGLDGDADAAQRPRRQGRRRVGHDRRDPRRAIGGRRCPHPSRRPPCRHAGDAGAGVAIDPRRGSVPRG